jgi:hypothetical protein
MIGRDEGTRGREKGDREEGVEAGSRKSLAGRASAGARPVDQQVVSGRGWPGAAAESVAQGAQGAQGASGVSEPSCGGRVRGRRWWGGDTTARVRPGREAVECAEGRRFARRRRRGVRGTRGGWPSDR